MTTSSTKYELSMSPEKDTAKELRLLADALEKNKKYDPFLTLSVECVDGFHPSIWLSVDIDKSNADGLVKVFNMEMPTDDLDLERLYRFLKSERRDTGGKEDAEMS